MQPVNNNYYEKLRLVSVSIAADGIDSAEFLQSAAGQPRFYWSDPRQNTTLAGFGIAADLIAWGNNRFDAIAQQAHALFTDAALLDNSAPHLFGGFAFRDDFRADNTWAIHHPAQFVLPHFQLSAEPAGTRLTLNALIPLDENPSDIKPDLIEALQDRLAQLQGHRATISDRPAPQAPNINYPMPPSAWHTLISDATTAMQRGDFDKVVLSRVCELKFAQTIGIDGALVALNEQYADCYRFVFEPRPNHAFFGATPELLIQTEGSNLHSMSLAGSAPRGSTQASDDAFGQTLLDDPKNRIEHKLVVDAMRQRLTPLTNNLDAPTTPGLLKLAKIQHLYTPFSAELKDPSGVLPLVKLLHPTPALGGSPRKEALAYMLSAEPVPRGWYAAPIGVLTPTLDGSFGVAIRSAVTQNDRVWLYAGAGIVAASDPQSEWEETALKFAPILNAFGLSEQLTRA